jgi:hypothetical protein
MKKIFVAYISIVSFSLFAQWIPNQNIGIQLGGIVSLGTHVNAFGFTLNAFYTSHFFQCNLGNQIKYNLTSYGKRKFFWENRTNLGLILVGGRKKDFIDFQFDGLNHQTLYSNGIGYNYLWYFDQANTSQRSGAWSLHINPISIYFENDVFAGQAKDRFRTGIIEVKYAFSEHTSFFTNFYIWTGETRNSVWVKESSDKCPNGYRILEPLPYGKTSHGIWSIGVHHQLFPHHVFSGKIGIDSEQIRHLIQNRFTHDLIFMPKQFPRNTPHYPRLNSDGKTVFDKREIRKNRFYFQLNLNDVWSN